MNEYLPAPGYRRILVLTFYVIGGAALIILLVRYALGAFLPFLLACLTAALLRPIAARIRRRTRMTARAAGGAALLLLLLVIGGGVGMLVFTVLSQAGELLGALTENADSLAKELAGLTDRLLDALPLSEHADREAWRSAIRSAVSEASIGLLSSMTAALPGWVARMLGSIPGAFLFLTVYVISAFSLCMREGSPIASLMRFLPPLGVRLIGVIRKQLARVGIDYIRAALVLLLLTFLQLYLGFLLLSVPYALLLAALIALIDLLPILGSGTVLIPWSIFCLLTHRMRLGAGLAILFLVLTVTRQVLEPRVVGKSIGLSPLATLTAMYAGWYLFGILGLILLPIGVTVLRPFFVTAKEGKGQAADLQEP